MTLFFRRALLQSAQGLPVGSIFHHFDAFATPNHHRIDSNWSKNDISVIFTTEAAAKSHIFKKETNFLILKLYNDMRE